MRTRHPACVICRVPHGVSIMVRNQDRGGADDGCRASRLAFGTRFNRYSALLRLPASGPANATCNCRHSTRPLLKPRDCSAAPRRANVSLARPAGSTCNDALGIDRVALLFLSLGALPHDRMWAAWLDGASGLVPLRPFQVLRRHCAHMSGEAPAGSDWVMKVQGCLDHGAGGDIGGNGPDGAWVSRRTAVMRPRHGRHAGCGRKPASGIGSSCSPSTATHSPTSQVRMHND